MKPIFESRKDFLSYDDCGQVISACFDFLAMHFKQKDLEGKISSKILKQILRHFNIGYLKEELDFLVFEQLKKLLEECEKKGKVGVEEDNHEFVDKFREEWSYLHVMDSLFFMLEKGKKYKLAVLVLITLLHNK